MTKHPFLDSIARNVVNSISILVPALNEEKCLPTALEEILQILNEEKVEDFEIIVFDDGSTDNTGKIAEEYREKDERVSVFHNATPQGIGHAYKKGIELASKKYYIYVPGDAELDCSLLRNLFRDPSKSDLILSYLSNDPRSFFRRMLSKCYTKLLNLSFGLHITYYNGANLIPLKLLRGIRIDTDGHAFMAETIIRLVRQGHTYSEIPYQSRVRAAGKSNALRLKNIVSVLTALWRLRTTL